MCLRLILKVHSSKELARWTVAKPAEIFPSYIPELQKQKLIGNLYIEHGIFSYYTRVHTFQYILK